MTQDSPKPSLNELPQVYDTSFKDWVSQQAPTILPLLLPGAIYEATLNIEVIKPTMRVDKVFKILYDGEERILDLEFETGYDKHLISRLLVYNAGLYRDHHLPVITIVVYPFRVKMAVSPLELPKILTFHFQTLPLFTLDAEQIVRQHHTCMYPLLPTMENVHADLITQVMRELTQLYRHDEVTLAQQFVWMKLLLERTNTIPLVEKEKIEKVMSMYDQLWEESPTIQNMRDEYQKKGLLKGLQEGLQEGLQKGLQEGLQEGRLEGLQLSLVNIVRAMYPDLAEFAQQQVSQFDKPDALEQLIQKVVTAPNADAVRLLLDVGAK